MNSSTIRPTRCSTFAKDETWWCWRTFSKIHGLAGLRIGYGVATADLVEVLHKTRQPFNVNSIAQAGALAALEDDAHLRETKRVIDEGRAYLQEQFCELKVPFVPAIANFVMVNVGDGCALFEKLLRRKSSCGRSKVMAYPNGSGSPLARWGRIKN